MGLLEKAQKHKDDDIQIVEEIKEEPKDNIKKTKGLLEKAKNQKKKKTKKQKPEKKAKKEIEKTQSKKENKKEKSKETKKKTKKETDENKELIEEKTGFGYKGLGTRRILYDKERKEYFYKIIEPKLNKEEKKIQDELTHLFKMLADINVSDMEDKEKEKFLEDTLNQIVIDNNIQFFGLNKKENKELIRLFELLEDTDMTYLKNEKEVKFLINTLDQIVENKDNNIQFLKLEEDEGNKIKKVFKSIFSKNKNKENTIKKPKKQPETKKDLKNKNEKGLKTIFTKVNKKEREAQKEEIEKKSQEIKDKIYYHLFKDFLGYGKIDIIMKDRGIEDISCDGHEVPIFIYHKKYDEISSNVMFEDEEELNSFVVRLAQICGKQISVFSPIVDGKLPDGSRLQTTLARTVTRGSTFTIRRFKENPLTPIDLIKYKSISFEMAAFFWMAIENGASVLFCGGTASGKTTALNALSLFIPESHKVVTIEDTREINLPHKNWIAGTTRQGFSASDEKTGKDIDMFDLIRAALRQRPKVIMVGEVRGKEAYSLFQAMSTGHTAYSTVHASDIHTLIQRLENPPIELPRALLTSLEIIVFQNAVDIKGKTVRRMSSVTEIVKLDSDTNQLIFMEPYKWVSKTDDRFESSGSSKVLNNIRLQNDWSDIELCEELEKRMLVLKWMVEKDITDYREVGRIVNLYHKYPDDILKKAKEEINK